MQIRKDLNSIALPAIAIVNLIIFIVNFYRGITTNSWVLLICAGCSISAVLFCVWTMGYKHASREIETITHRTHQEDTLPTYVDIRPLSVADKKTGQEGWEDFQEGNI